MMRSSWVDCPKHGIWDSSQSRGCTQCHVYAAVPSLESREGRYLWPYAKDLSLVDVAREWPCALEYLDSQAPEFASSSDLRFVIAGLSVTRRLGVTSYLRDRPLAARGLRWDSSALVWLRMTRSIRQKPRRPLRLFDHEVALAERRATREVTARFRSPAESEGMTKKCTCCGATSRWSALRLVGVQHTPADEHGPAEALELRDCPCGSTLSLRVDPTSVAPAPRA